MSLGAGDRSLLQDAIFFQCDSFLTVERKVPKNAGHIEPRPGLRSAKLSMERRSRQWKSYEPALARSGGH
jgi:hypothetical protein